MVKFKLPILFIGGIGGSGTRAVANAIMSFGYYAGDCLNNAYDNLIFTELFKRPHWIRRGVSEKKIHQRLQLFERVMREGVNLTSIARWPALGRFWHQQRQGFDRFKNVVGWMTKEPNCHLFLEQIIDHWPDVLFIYVTRHPLDMAYSNNKGQLGNWGWLFEIDLNTYVVPEVAQLEYWIRTQKRLNNMSARHKERIYTLKFDTFVVNPMEAMLELAERLNLSIDKATLIKAASKVIVPESIGRWRKHDLSIFTPRQIDFCRTVGWPVDLEIN
ncbi:hypothetical protein A1OE_998 [Candidatus Endolissoclinum faulkneri L2]|uniref:Sulfotransferase family protein n=1 Tax=Candidatus Endolissoclinum faulkneri L2 TaxID=1193729 RepID=K7YRK1_9PROT|nr:sulfotransferase [Candidatus Endolissoclinum faulkneri]AFX99179.1 hypothetical protein A1OE_998 [Candidatus Endolissoclinum faulkneri L2]